MSSKRFSSTPKQRSISIYRQAIAEILPRESTSKQVKHESYFEFFKWAWSLIESEELTLNFHHELLCNELEKVAKKVIAREPFDYNLIINISPGETKSTITTVIFPVWLWTQDPTLRVITASYSKELALYHALKSRDLIQTTQFQEMYGDTFQMRKDMGAKSYYGNTEGGQRISASVGSTITGKHAHIIIKDDPINPQQAKSDKERENINEWGTTTINRRKVNEKTTPTIMVMQRLHEDDPTGVLAKKWGKVDKLKWIRLPADDRYQIEPAELKELYPPDGPLRVMNPSRKPKSVIDQKENEHTAEDFAGQYGQNPQPAEGNKLKKKWFTQRFIYERFIDQAGANLIWNAVLDGAYTKNTKNSATACLIYASYGNKLYLYDYRSWWLEFPEIVDSVPSFVLNVFDPRRSTLFVEPKAIGKSLVQTLRKEGGINIVEDELPQGVTQMQGKEMRVDNITPYCRGMNIILRDGVDWQPFIDQCATFPNASHSDLVDCLVMAVEKVQFNSILSDPDFYS